MVTSPVRLIDFACVCFESEVTEGAFSLRMMKLKLAVVYTCGSSPGVGVGELREKNSEFQTWVLGVERKQTLCRPTTS